MTVIGLSINRIAAMAWRYWYLLKGSWPRIVDIIYWPTVQMIMWGFIQTFVAEKSGFFATAFGILLGAVMLWDVLFRSQISLSISFFEEIWSRNLGHLMVSPLKPGEFIAAMIVMSLIRTVIGLFPATILAIWFFGFSIYDLGFGLVAFFFNLAVFGWAIGLFVSGVILRFGLGAENLAWAFTFGLAPFCGVYYPIEVLPAWMEVISAGLPPAYIFEGMRSVLIEQSFRTDLILTAFALNAFYIAGGIGFFLWMLHKAKERGMLLQIGE